ncbi:hypothetical protein HW115_01750 [Verrucomicrobiaceae bacterium N1E253]|uniref:Uncharacterized protein n=1 Tax=Oceaniferula marina TaxID=2748318 RepID=A0A851G9C8_9BACT|nr:hypothetical protein [Oceaniferula marina]NWK54318.1 hypothetical protein [Oceaniferula marina]
MPLYGSKDFHPYAAKNHLEAAKAFARGLLKADGSTLTPGDFILTGQTSNALGGITYHFKYSLLDALGGITAQRQIDVIHYHRIRD